MKNRTSEKNKAAHSAFLVCTCLLFVVLFAFQNCGQHSGSNGWPAEPEGPFSQPQNPEKIEGLKDFVNRSLEHMKNLAGAELSCRSSADCIAMPAGLRACGGPSSYLITSKTNPHVEEIGVVQAQVEDSMREIIVFEGTTSSCEFREPPPLACDQASLTCVAQ